MIPPLEEAPDGRPVGAAGLPGVQPGDQEPRTLGVPDAWLTDPAFDETAAAVDRQENRLAGDLDLYNTLALGRFSGSDYEYFADELARYGLAVIGSWVRSGLIYGKCRDRGMGGLAPPVWDLGSDDVNELANLTVGEAVVKFRETVLLKKRWDPRKGASLRTFFIGQCLIRFANVYRSWHRDQQQRPLTSEFSDEMHPQVRPHDRALDDIVAQAELAKLEDPRLQRALIWTASGWPQREIAAELVVSEKAVERMLANHRQRIQKRRSA